MLISRLTDPADDLDAMLRKLGRGLFVTELMGHSALDGLLIAIEAAPAARGWAGALVSYEALILSALGFGQGDGGRPDDWPDVLASLNQSGARLDRYLFSDRRADVLAARERLVERLKRAAA